MKLVMAQAIYSLTFYHGASGLVSDQSVCHCGGPSGAGRGIPPSTSVFACQLQSTSASYSHSSACCRDQKHKRETPRYFSKKKYIKHCTLGNRGSQDEKLFLLFLCFTGF